MKKRVRSLVQVKVLVREPTQPRRPSWQMKLLTAGLMGALLTLAIGGIGVAVRLIVNPGSVGWVSWVIPGWDQTPLAGQAPQTLSEIRSTAAKSGFQVGNSIHLSTYPGSSRGETGFDDVLLPIYQPQSYCEPDDSPEICQKLVEVRVYRPQKTTLRLTGREPGLELLDQLAISGLEEHFVIAPLSSAGIAHHGSTRQLPLTSVTFINGESPLPGVWLHFSGDWQRGSSRMVYGQVVRYDPIRGRLQPLVTWTSPAAEIPLWQSVTGEEASLVVNQTIGLEPKFQVYQFTALGSPARPVQVTPITLAETGLDDRTYKNGLLLARNGLWSLAQKQLEASQVNQPSWTAAAQAQLDFVALHARITQTQADREWASPRQQILALLIDGQWTEALTVVKTAHTNGYTLNTLLTDPSDRLQQRIETALRVNPSSVLQQWGVLVTAVQTDRATAIEWLNKQPQELVRGQPLQELFALLETPSAPVIVASAPAVSSSPASMAMSPASALAAYQMIGTAMGRSSITPEGWIRPNPEDTLILNTNQTWYEIQVLQLQDGQQWQTLPSNRLMSSEDPNQTARSLWEMLGLTQNPEIQLMTWAGSTQPQVIQATIRAIQVQNGDVRLLAVAETHLGLDSPLLAMTPSSLSWLQPVEVLTLTHLNQQYPEWTTALLPALGQELQHAGYTLPVSETPSQTLLKELGSWSLQLADLTGDSQLEGVLSLDMSGSDAVSEVANSQANSEAMGHTQTLIFSSQGSVLYSDLGSPTQSLKAIVNLYPGNLPALIVHDTQGYRVEQWSASHQRFESSSPLIQ
ncbi:hypothetical protein C7B76_03020 [filamentous cyanobacterium CCP2]|nr:hypothetical protein C7B76_03020 [filamentous cyanobacterium CCP2]